MKKQIKILLFLFLLILLIQKYSMAASADIGPAFVYSQGGLLQSSSQTTNISMDYEKVTLTYGTPQYGGVTPIMPAHVLAVFKMKNNGSQPETINVFFPSNDSVFAGGWGGDDIENFKVNGKLISKDGQTKIPMTLNGREEEILVYQWQETFNPQQITEITVEYDTKSGKDYEVYYLTYVLGTGRSWQGNIKQGEINFILPENLIAYSVLDQAPLVENNKLPFRISGNTITISFLEYEPNADEVIVLGVYDFDKVKAIERLKNEPQTFTNTLKIASLFRQLSGGPHCAFCTGMASQNAESYYSLALDQATSKEEINSVLKSFAYGEGDWGNADDFLKMIGSLGECEINDLECRANIYSDRELRETAFGLNFAGGINQADFLIRYAEKMQAYDPTILTIVNNYINGAKVANEWLEQKYPNSQATISPAPSRSKSHLLPITQENILFLTIGGATGMAVVIGVALLKAKWKIRAKNKREILEGGER